jgi:oligopeptide transport system ATP-binding protein
VTPPVLEVAGITKTFPAKRDLLGRVQERVHAVVDVDLEVAPGETLGLVGESGSGKSTLGRLVLRLIDPDHGRIVLDGEDITTSTGTALRRARRKMHMVFQDPFSSLDPSWLVADIVGEPLRAHLKLRGSQLDERVSDLLTSVGLEPAHRRRYAYEFSGGQRQRIAIARALAVEPDLVVCDEPVSALDVSTQAQVLALLEDLQSRMGLSYLFIAHDLAVVHHVSDRIAVMYLGRIVESAAAKEVYESPRHPYTAALLSAIPHPDPRARQERILLTGEIPSPIHPPAGCRFHPRCPHAMDICTRVEPELHDYGGVSVACHLHHDGPILAGETVLDLPVSPRRSNTESNVE